MRGRFDDEDEQSERQRPQRDTELTLGTGTLLLLFLGLALICGACFGLGYEVGRGVAPSPAAGQQAAGGAASNPQSSASKSKPSATANPGVPAPVALKQSSSQQGSSNQQSSTQTVTQPVTQPVQTPAQPQVHPALPAYNAPLPSGDSGMHAVLPPPVQLMVQIAAVSHQEDADVLSAALRKHGYAVVARRDAGDGLIHVRIGPFSSRDEANKWRQKLLDDGYNAMIQ